MAWRFKASKYKNAAPIVPKPECYVREISVGSYQTYGNNITASAKFMAFNWDHAGSSIAVLPVDDFGRKSKLMPLLHAHSDTVTDMDFSPFHDGLLVTGSQDCLVKIWHIPESGLQESLSNPEVIFPHKQRRVECVGFHPTADFLLHTAYTTLALWDLILQKEVLSSSDHEDVIQSVSWKRDGSLIATSCKDKQVRIIDPRVENWCVQIANSHQNIKDSRIVWLGEQNKILTTGFDSSRLRQVVMRDLRNFSEPEKLLELDCSTGILIPLYDPDTGMLFLAGKGDTTILYMEVSDKDPYFTEGLRHVGEQTKGACLVPKRALNVMQGEVNRVLQLTSNSVIPITYQVPRKTYRDFHADLYPDTPGYMTELTAEAWIQGKNISVPKISLDPSKRQNDESSITVHRGTLAELKAEVESRVIETSQPVLEPISKSDFSVVKDVKEIMQSFESEEKCDKQEKLLDVENGMSTVPPKPMPRVSRTGSICEPIDDGTIPKPIARPRTNSCAPVVTSVNPNLPIVGGYKPRLGPKPFTPPKLNESESFDKVFCVPPVPNTKVQNGTHEHEIDNQSNIIVDPKNLIEKPTTPELEEKKSPLNDITSNGTEGDGDTSAQPKTPSAADCCKFLGPASGDCDSKIQSTTDDANDDESYKPRTPSTAERRKIFEGRSNSRENDSEDNFDVADQSSNFERASVQRSSIAERRKMYENRSLSVQETTHTLPEKVASSPVMLRRKGSFKSNKEDEEKRKTSPISKQQSLDPHVGRKSELNIPIPKRTSTVFGRVSKFRHLKGTPAHKSFHIENIRNISRQIPGECDGFQANSDRVAVPLNGPGGKLAILELSKRGKLPDGVIPTVVHGSNIMDFMWDPFDNCRLAVAYDDGIIKLWTVSADGLKEPTNKPKSEFNAHNDKIYFIKFHPTAENVLASGSYDMTIRIWDLSSLTEKIVLKGHTEQIFSFSWSACGIFCATISKDSKIRIYKPRASDLPIEEGKGPVGTRGARITWALEGRFIVVMGFDKCSEGKLQYLMLRDLKSPLNTIGLDVSPSILLPFYDEDSSTLFLTGKGDSTIYAFEITQESPYICPLSHHRCNGLHQGLSFLPKNACDVANVEFAKAYRLTNNSIEPLSFTVPRIKTDLFQDDLFPPTMVTWVPTLSSSEWFSGKDKIPLHISLQPEGMDLLSSSQTTDNKINKTASPTFFPPAVNRLGYGHDLSGHIKTKQDEIQKSVSNRLEINLRLEQDDMEGVDEHGGIIEF